MGTEKSDESGYPHIGRVFSDQEEEIKRLKAELQAAKAEIIRLRRHLGEIP